MARWFRKMGARYAPRMNQIVRIYWPRLLLGDIKAFPSANYAPRSIIRTHDISRESQERTGDAQEIEKAPLLGEALT